MKTIILANFIFLLLCVDSCLSKEISTLKQFDHFLDSTYTEIDRYKTETTWDTMAVFRMYDEQINVLEALKKEKKQFHNKVEEILIETYIYLGRTYSKMGHYEKSIQFLDKAFDEQIGAVNDGYSGYCYFLGDLYGHFDNLKKEYPERFKKLIKAVKNLRVSILKNYSDYSTENPYSFPQFTYQNYTDPNLTELRKKYHLKDVAGEGDEISQIINLMNWTHYVVEHNGSAKSPDPATSLNILKGWENSGRAVNCKMMAVLMNDVFLSMGFKSRYITCMPIGDTFNDCHVTIIVYSTSLDKWIYIDPSFNAYIMDKNGMLLNHAEIRKALVDGDSLFVNDDLDHNGKPYGGGKMGYLKYMAKNLFRFSCPLHSEFGYESTKEDVARVYLNPKLYKLGTGQKISKLSNGFKRLEYYSNNDIYFWQPPID